jgi:peptidoglycan/LPS O-acetylase OafA/YrhL
VGLLRLILALTVVNWHLPIIGIDPPVTRAFHSFISVCSFFIISGFYMSMVLNETYGARRYGLADFYLNRALRLFPTYWVVLIGHFVYAGYPDGLVAWLRQATIVPSVLWGTLTVNPINVLTLGPMYTVGLEILFYLLAPLVVRRSLPALVAALVAAVALHFLPYWLGLPSRPWQYEFFPAILMFFLVGALSYRLYVVVRTWSFDRRWGHLCWLALTVYVARYADVSVPFTNAAVPLVFYAVVALTLPFLFLATKASSVDRLLGDLSYPLYVVHFPVLFAFNTVTQSSVLVTAVSLALSVVLVVIVERPVDAFRHRLSVERWLGRRDRQGQSTVPTG